MEVRLGFDMLSSILLSFSVKYQTHTMPGALKSPPVGNADGEPSSVPIGQTMETVREKRAALALHSLP